ncbi:glutamine--fructose-6-phosphate transaminase [Dyella jiangningensis]|uniref:SIS domain-containing protein n=1 Tax=Dyella sp. AtDHG13 TaxID=1938897 RepID=UPI00088CD675|nr:SIS domain-containing protein [Dyella sp. AtDHG13]PXV52838.1 glutamine--fructose-6-phosphate transaminase [Dyella sp. AtDHG13]SDK30627.1 glutamine--fructose-6-phosphate transaminase [Dyella jiangningensis]
MKEASDTLMYREAHEAAAVVERQLRENAQILKTLGEQLRARPPRFIVTCARGSSDHAAAYAKYVFETRLGLITASASPSISSIYDADLHLDGALFIAISQSGKSPDLLRSAQAAKDAGARVVALVNVEDSPLAQMADTFVPLRAGPELSVAATKSYLATLAAVLQLTAHWGDDAELHGIVERLPEDLRRGWDCDWSPMVEGLTKASSLFVVGRGYGFGAALEAALKLKETCGLHAEAFSAAEVKHGPMAIVGEGFPVLFFAQGDGTQDNTIAVANEFRARGARVFIAAPGNHDPDKLPLPDGVSPMVTPLLAVQSFYRAASELSLARGYDPDVPPHLRKVTETM